MDVDSKLTFRFSVLILALESKEECLPRAAPSSEFPLTLNGTLCSYPQFDNED